MRKKGKKKGFFVASTGQHVGKTTTCLGLLAGLSKQLKEVGFLKPIGQEHVEVEEGVHVDKDVLLFKNHFGLTAPPEVMSPLLFPRGFTRSYLDGKVSEEEMRTKVESAFKRLTEKSEMVVVEGTGHVGVGSIVNLCNAQVASLLGLNMVLIASGGLGSSFDALSVNKALCDHYQVKISGIILNRVHDEKREMVLSYMEKALNRWQIPILGCIPYAPFLSKPTMKDFEQLFGATLLSGDTHHMRHFKQMRLVAASLENYRELISPNELIIIPANREDIILTTLSKHWEVKLKSPRDDLSSGFILTGATPPRQSILEALKKAHIPMLYAPLSSYEVMERITSYTVKIRTEDKAKIKEAIHLVESHIHFKQLLTQIEG